MRFGFLLAVLACALSAGEAWAAPGTINARSFELQWVFEPPALPNGDFWVPRRGTVIETRLLPTELYVTDDRVTAADGTILMGVGQQLIKLNARQPTACSMFRGRTGRVVIRRVCLVDTDNDGRYDSYFERALSTSNFLVEWTGHIPENMDRIAATGLRTIPSAEMTDAPIIRLLNLGFYDGGPSAPVTAAGVPRNVINFGFEAGTARQQVRVGDDCMSDFHPDYCASSAFPSQFRLAGLVLDLLERRGQEVRLRVAAPFDRVTVRIADLSDGRYASGQLFLVRNP
jgi:hypothetical protein